MIQGLEEALDALLGAALAELDPVPGRVLIAPGAEVAWDACCDGQLWVRVASVEDATPLVANGRSAQSCGPLAWLVTFGLGVLRCSPSVDDRGRVPPAESLTDNARQLVADMQGLARALACSGGVSGRSQLWTPLGPEGGCAGGEWTVGVLMLACGCE